MKGADPMGHKQGNLTFQISEKLKGMACFGQSKHEIKRRYGKEGLIDRIFSFSTMKAYIDNCVKFGKWCHQEHGCKTIAQCRKYVGDYLLMKQETYAPYSVKLMASALAKLYSCSTEDFETETKARLRQNLTRSRLPRQMDRHFSEARNQDLVTFCRSVGPRRCELEQIRGNQLRIDQDGIFIDIGNNQGKGGKDRSIPVIGNTRRVVELMKAAGDGLVFPKVHDAADIHHYRAEYAAALYKMHARPLDICRNDPYIDPKTGHRYKDSVYRCRKDQAGKCFDRRAMLIVSQALGHDRISVIAGNYLYEL